MSPRSSPKRRKDRTREDGGNRAYGIPGNFLSFYSFRNFVINPKKQTTHCEVFNRCFMAQKYFRLQTDVYYKSFPQGSGFFKVILALKWKDIKTRCIVLSNNRLTSNRQQHVKIINASFLFQRSIWPTSFFSLLVLKFVRTEFKITGRRSLSVTEIPSCPKSYSSCNQGGNNATLLSSS